jgi:hypothetical protein
VASTLAPHSENGSQLLKEALNDYRFELFPFLEGEKEKGDKDAKAVLEHWTDKRAFSVKPLWRANENRAVVSKLRRGRDNILKMEEAKRGRRHRRLK